jgi:hypothetical protein
MTRKSRRNYRPNRRLALKLLASRRDGYTDGYTEAILQAHGFSTEQMVHLVQAGHATAHSQRVLAGRRVIEMPPYLLTFRFTADSLPRLLSTSY